MDEWGSGRAVAMETYRSQSPLILAEDLSAPDVSNLASDCSQILDEKRDLTVRDFGFRAQIGSPGATHPATILAYAVSLSVCVPYRPLAALLAT